MPDALRRLSFSRASFLSIHMTKQQTVRVLSTQGAKRVQLPVAAAPKAIVGAGYECCCKST